jgi:hypothetical protein
MQKQNSQVEVPNKQQSKQAQGKVPLAAVTNLTNGAHGRKESNSSMLATY